ncbi:MAG: endonuclease/exonuclease/phosphatase family protein [Actinobacteria bacterium]|nr:endonuclease/exonuclease/phosphatase family protein [Actinomycetota bacterium]
MRWRVLTWNVRGSAKPDLERLAAVIGEQRPDVVALQEIRRSQARLLARALGWQQTWTRKHYPYTPMLWWLAEGLAVMSPHAIEHPASRSLTPGLSTWTYRHRVVLAATVRRDGASVRVYDTHLAAHHHPDARIQQAERVAAMINDDRLPAIVAGDLNAHGEQEVVRAFHAAGLRDPGGASTHPSIAPRSRLDYVLVPERAQLIDDHVPDGGEEWAVLSDHLPLAVEVELA